MKRVGLILLCMLLMLGGCKNPAKLEDGIAAEVYIARSLNNEFDYYYVQNDTIIKADGYALSFNSGVPLSIRDQAGSYFGLDGYGMYSEGYGQLDDYYIDETTEIYLYNKDRVPNILYFKNGVQQEIKIATSSCRQIQVMNGYLYLLSFGPAEEEYNKATVEKIHLETGDSEMLHYRFPIFENAMAEVGFATTRVNSDESLFYRLRELSQNGDSRELLFLAYPDGTYREIEASDPANNEFELAFETENGYGILETPRYAVENPRDSFFLRLRYFDRQGNELEQKMLDSSEMIAKTEKTLHLSRGAAYHEGELYLSVSDGSHLHLFRYNIDDQTTIYDGEIEGVNSIEYRLVSVRNGKPYTFYGNGLS
ncbi:MAG: hypothetical protein IJ333_04915 [Clostridia bacterium]|nr:hypothetical protein [Clostridia bacterium]